MLTNLKKKDMRGRPHAGMPKSFRDMTKQMCIESTGYQCKRQAVFTSTLKSTGVQ